MKRRIAPAVLRGSAALRDQGDDARVERIWDRLEGEIGGLHAARPRSRWPLACAALVVGFAGGFIARGSRERGVRPQPEAAAAADRQTAPGGQPSGHALPVDRSQGADADAAATPSAKPSLKPRAPADARHARSAAPPWAAACAEGDFDKAFELANKHGDVSAALGAATDEQKQCLADGARLKNHDEIAILALKQVADGSSNPVRAAVATGELARIYEDKKEKGDDGAAVEARHLEELKEILSKGELLDEPGLCKKIELSAGAGLYRTVRDLAERYNREYPNGSCTREVNRLAEQAKQKLAAQGPAAADPSRP